MNIVIKLCIDNNNGWIVGIDIYIYLEHVWGWVQGVVGDPRQGEVEGVLAEGGQGQHRLQPVANLHTAIQ